MAETRERVGGAKEKLKPCFSFGAEQQVSHAGLEEDGELREATVHKSCNTHCVVQQPPEDALLTDLYLELLHSVSQPDAGLASYSTVCMFLLQDIYTF